MAGIWDKVTTITTPSWTSVSEITTPSWSAVTISHSITYSESSGVTPSIDLVNAWNLISDKWEHFTYDYEDLII